MGIVAHRRRSRLIAGRDRCGAGAGRGCQDGEETGIRTSCRSGARCTVEVASCQRHEKRGQATFLAVSEKRRLSRLLS